VSIQAVADVLALPPIGQSERLVLIALANHANDEGFSYLKRETIMQEAGFSKKGTVTDVLGRLVARRFIVRIVNGWAGIDGQIPAHLRPNLYQLTLDQADIPGRDPYPSHGETPYPSHGETPYPPDGYLEPSVEPSVEPRAASRLRDLRGSGEKSPTVEEALAHARSHFPDRATTERSHLS
jgi:hypothetical protein